MCFPPNNYPSAFLSSCIYSTVSLELKRPDSLVWFGSSVSNQLACGISPCAVPHRLTPSVQKQKIKVSVCFSVCSQCPCRVTASESSRGASWQQIRAVEEDNLCSLPGVHRSHEVVRIITILQTTCSEAQFNVVNMTGGYLTLLLAEWSRATPLYITFCFFQAVNRNNSMFYVGWHVHEYPWYVAYSLSVNFWRNNRRRDLSSPH